MYIYIYIYIYIYTCAHSIPLDYTHLQLNYIYSGDILLYINIKIYNITLYNFNLNFINHPTFRNLSTLISFISMLISFCFLLHILPSELLVNAILSLLYPGKLFKIFIYTTFTRS